MINNLDNMTFPKSPLKEENLNPEQLKQFLAIRADYEKDSFVTEGHFEVRALGAKEFVRPIPEDECAVTSLLTHTSGHVYGGTSGKKSHMFFYNPGPDADAVADIGIVWDAPSEIPVLRELPGGIVLGVVNPKDDSAKLFLYRPCEVLLREKDFTGLGVRLIFDMPAEDQLFFSTIDPCHSSGEIEILKTELPEHVSDLALFDNGEICLLGAKTGTIYFLDENMKNIRSIGALDPNGNFSPRFGVIDCHVYACGLYGQIFEVYTDGLRKCNCMAPSLKGLKLYNRVTAWCSFEGVLYGGTIDGLLFKFDPETETVITLGKPSAQPNVCGMAVSGKKIFAVLGNDDDCAHLTSYDTQTGDLRDLGCPLARSERPWNGYNFGSMCVNQNGHIFMGECDRISQLFIYFPKIY